MPYLSSTLFVLVVVLSFLVALTGYFLFVRSLFSGFARRAEVAWTERSWLSLLLGVPVLAVLVFTSIALLNAPLGALRIVGFGVAGLSLGFVFAGTSGLAARIGRGLSSPTDTGREWARTLRGGVVLEISMLLPILGWFLIAPIALLGGAGAAARALFGPSRVPAPRPVEAAPPAAAMLPAPSASPATLGPTPARHVVEATDGP